MKVFEVHNCASHEANDNTTHEDALSLFGDDSLNETEDDELLTQINTSLSSSEEAEPPNHQITPGQLLREKVHLVTAVKFTLYSGNTHVSRDHNGLLSLG